MPKIHKLLIANRGEIALRIIRTCNRLNIKTVAVYSEADKDYPFVKAAGVSYLLGPAEASKSYLNLEKLIEICRTSGADAVHPGYGFLSENEGFAKALQTAGIIFIGPSPDAIRMMGDKTESRKKMKESGVPVIPGYDGNNQDEKFLQEEAGRIGYPVMIKASAGGGGKGMRRVDRKEDFLESLHAAKREAKNFFSNDSVFLEKYVLSPRHIEVQIFGDSHGNYAALHDRDCSVQRRHQKVIEEAPAPLLPENIRKEIRDASILAASSIRYENAGTVEFVYSDGKFYFLEMNTRLQVEHPVTEMITGLDLVELQIRTAEGEKLPFTADTVPQVKGHAVELRLYAEEHGLPRSGKIHAFGTTEGLTEGQRIDSGVESGSYVSVHYDSMIAKLISFGKNREEAIQNALSLTEKNIVFGIPVNHSFLNAVLKHEKFREGGVNTGFLEEYSEDLKKTEQTEESELAECIFLTHSVSSTVLEGTKGIIAGRKFLWEEIKQENPPNVILNRELIQEKRTYLRNGEEFTAEAVSEDEICISHKSFQKVFSIKGLTVSGKNCIHWNGKKVFYERYSGHIYLHHFGKNWNFHLKIQGNSGSKNSGFKSPMPGKIISVRVKPGDNVVEGDILMIVEAMKMENQIRAYSDLSIEEVYFKEGDLVTGDDQLLKAKELDS